MNNNSKPRTDRFGYPLANQEGYADTEEGVLQFLKDASTLNLKGAVVEEGEAFGCWTVTIPNYYGRGTEATVLVWLDDQDFEVC